MPLLSPVAVACALVLITKASFAEGGDSSASLGALQLRPDGQHALPSEHPVRFTFAADAHGRPGVEMQRFHLRVKLGSLLVAEQRVESTQPVAELKLTPGRYHWSVQWWSSTGEASSVGESEAVVAENATIWDGVPWLGAADKNEFEADFNLAGKSSDRVELLISTLGFGYATVNGQEVSRDVLSYSGWTNTDKRVLFRTYDVSDLLNASKGGRIFIALGCGYRCDPKGRFPQYKDPANRSTDSVAKIFRLQLRINGQLGFHSGSLGWLSRQGAVVEDSVYDGELFVPASAGKWASAPSLPSGWGPSGTMVAATFPGVQITRTDAPISITQPADGVHVVDFGSNVAGVCSISVPRPAVVSLKHGELMQHAKLPTLKKPDPSRVYFGNLRSAAANDTLVLAETIQEWWPRFTYHGFRYVEVYGYPGNLTAASIKRLVLNTALEERASAAFGDEVLQAIHRGSKGVQRSNLMNVPTDCPQRDERLGWMGDASLTAESFMLHFRYKPMIAAFLDSMGDEMGIDGSLPDVVPFKRFGGRPADLSWSAAFLENLWSIWKSDGDLTVARTHWQKVQSHIANLRAQYTKAGSLTRLHQPYGDWCPPPETPGGKDKEATPGGFASAAALLRTLGQVADLGKALGGDSGKDASAAEAWRAALAEEFNAIFYDRSQQRYANGVMLTYVLPLALEIVPASEKEALVKKLLQYIADHGDTWTGGIINNKFLFDVLHDNGAAEVALKMLQRKDYPSYGYMYFNDLEPANECMWELPDAPYQGDGMNSRAHHMFSSVGHYLITRVAGLTLQGSSEVRLVVGLLKSSQASLLSDFGPVHFTWTRQGKLTIEVQIPVGLRGSLFVPYEDGTAWLLDAAGPVAQASAHEVVDGVKFSRFHLSSGLHHFVAARDVGGQLVI
eukprot:TRINITY_DN18151_c1_g1_i1.p1 TRINITY_DN18151_c1_g1~~TRINITY_DN18151_c1_g1_i1.p1  ORF type:complete len:903 (-),score=173.32 TRINITY_DN18151_c1_g1_i1:107-2815(-)